MLIPELAQSRHPISVVAATACAAGVLSKFNSIDKVDPTNMQQLELMWAHLRHNMAAVAFWLTFCLLPLQTSQFPSQLKRSAWNLADNAAGDVVGCLRQRRLPCNNRNIVIYYCPLCKPLGSPNLPPYQGHAGHTCSRTLLWNSCCVYTCPTCSTLPNNVGQCSGNSNSSSSNAYAVTQGLY